jgi:hypothetical protein
LSDAPDFAMLKPETVRAGLTADQIKNLTIPIDGHSTKYELPFYESFPFPTQLEIRLFRSDTGFLGLGEMRVELPIEELGDIIHSLEDVTGRSPQLDGRFAMVPIEIGFDAQMRSTFSNILGQKNRDKPHDCFMVVGTCKSAKFDSAVGWSYAVYTTYEQDGRFYSMERNNPKYSANDDVVAAAIYSVDEYGMILDLSSIDFLDEVPKVRLTRQFR